MPQRQLYLTVPERDCIFMAFRGRVTCTHPASKAVGESFDGQSYGHNRVKAYRRMLKSQQFKDWCRKQEDKYLRSEENPNV